MERLFTIIYILLFLLMISTPLLKLAVYPDDTNYIQWFERRETAIFPQPNSPIAYWLVSFESWFNDHFGFRKQLITFDSLIKYFTFKVSANPDKILAGKDDWLFLGPWFNDYVNVHRGLNQFTQTELEQWVKKFEHRYKWLADRDIPFLLVLVPNKSTIYPEMMPDWATVVNPDGRLDQVIKGLAKTAVPFLDLRETLMDAKGDNIVYFKQDSHWNNYGAYIGYRAIMDRLSLPSLAERSLGFELRPWGSTDEKEVWPDKGLTAFLLLTPYFNDINIVSTSKLDADIIISDGAGQILEQTTNKMNMVFEDRVYLNPEANAKVKILLIRDSFANLFSKYLHETINQLYYTDNLHLSTRKLKDIVNRFQPDIVIHEMIERYLVLEQE